MRKNLTIGEAADLLGTSTYNLRYYEKEGIISPSVVSENGYRMFTVDDIIYIRCIIMLRESGVAIKDIKKLMDSYSKENYINALKKSYNDVTIKIDKLIKVKQQLEKSLESMQKENNTFLIKQIKKRKLIEVKKSDYRMDYSIKEMYDSAQKKGIDKSLIYSDEFHYILYDDNISMCILSDTEGDGVLFDEGNYLCYSFYVKDDDELETKIIEFLKHIEDSKLKVGSELLLVINLKASMKTVEGFFEELQIRVV